MLEYKCVPEDALIWRRTTSNAQLHQSEAVCRTVDGSGHTVKFWNPQKAFSFFLSFYFFFFFFFSHCQGSGLLTECTLFCSAVSLRRAWGVRLRRIKSCWEFQRFDRDSRMKSSENISDSNPERSEKYTVFPSRHFRSGPSESEGPPREPCRTALHIRTLCFYEAPLCSS